MTVLALAAFLLIDDNGEAWRNCLLLDWGCERFEQREHHREGGDHETETYDPDTLTDEDRALNDGRSLLDEE